ncbi:integrase protein [Marine Group I thaumarchaeote SCGC AAA799-E16]|nr:integrase protein [Marine Group I thaumarchaeote SCGC AAA799-E16]
MKSLEPIFIGRKNQPIRPQWLTDLIPKLAYNAGIQKKIRNSNITVKNEKTSHELRDLLKSTLIIEGVASYVCELAIGHKVGDSYEKQDKLYPNKSREEFMKASSKINIFSNYTNYLKEGSQLKEKIKQVEVLENRIEDNQKVVKDLIVDKQNESDKKTELSQMIVDLQKEVNSLKASKKHLQ